MVRPPVVVIGGDSSLPVAAATDAGLVTG